jgi:hypothetical protein
MSRARSRAPSWMLRPGGKTRPEDGAGCAGDTNARPHPLDERDGYGDGQEHRQPLARREHAAGGRSVAGQPALPSSAAASSLATLPTPAQVPGRSVGFRIANPAAPTSPITSGNALSRPSARRAFRPAPRPRSWLSSRSPCGCPSATPNAPRRRPLGRSAIFPHCALGQRGSGKQLRESQSCDWRCWRRRSWRRSSTGGALTGR